METVLVYPKEEEDIKTLKKVLKALNFKFEVSVSLP
jgi:DNA-binding phage protein